MRLSENEPMEDERMRWSFEIVPVGGHQKLAAGTFDATDLNAAKEHAQRVDEPNVSASAELDVRLMDGAGKEAWRGPYIGPHEKDVGKPA